MGEVLVIDYAWQHPKPAAIKAAGYVGVIRYMSADPSKDITADEIAALHAAGLSIRLVWETTATRATQGRLAGWSDRRAAEKRAAALGYPKACPIFYAVDCDVDPARVIPYFKGVNAAHQFGVGVYGSRKVIEGVWTAGLASRCWQTEAWSGTGISRQASLYQRVKPTATIKGALGGWDENVVLHPFPAWTPPAPKPVVPPAKPAVKPAVDVDVVVPATPPLSPADVTFLQALVAFLRKVFTTPFGGK